MAGGRPRVIVRRELADFPPPTPQPTPCRIWQGAVHSSGYGVLIGRGHQPSEPSPLRKVRGPSRWVPDAETRRGSTSTKMYAHRWVWEAVNGPIPPGQVVRHRCDNRLCYRLSHLELGTQADNVRDAAERGHLGAALILPPSKVRALFDLRDEGLAYSAIAEFFPEVSFATVKRIGRLGRAAFADLWDPTAVGWSHPSQDPSLPPPPSVRYAAWRNREP